MRVERLSDADDLLPALHRIGSAKNMLPPKLRGWVNVLGLYVQDKFIGYREYLTAGGKFRSYFRAFCEYTDDIDVASELLTSTALDEFAQWRVTNFDKGTWDPRFAQLVEPTVEIAHYISPEATGSLGKLKVAVNHYRATGEWLGLEENKCDGCGHAVSWWSYFFNDRPCVHCGGKVRKDEAIASSGEPPNEG